MKAAFIEATAANSEYVGTIEICEEVIVEGVKDDTVSLIRQNLVTSNLLKLPQEANTPVLNIGNLTCMWLASGRKWLPYWSMALAILLLVSEQESFSQHMAGP